MLSFLCFLCDVREGMCFIEAAGEQKMSLLLTSSQFDIMSQTSNSEPEVSFDIVTI